MRDRPVAIPAMVDRRQAKVVISRYEEVTVSASNCQFWPVQEFT
jgi:hypothetical protein